MFEILIDNKNGNVWDVTNLVSDVQWKTSRIGRPGSLEFSLIKGALYQSNAFQYSNGDIVHFRKNNQNVFYGYIFSIDGGQDEAVKILAYDQMRYLLTKERYVLSNVTASDVIRMIAKDFKLQLGRVDDTVYRIPTLIEDEQTLLDIIYKCLDKTLISRGLNFVLFDDFDAISLRNIEDLVLNFFVGKGSLMTDFSFKTSIDSDTYNRIKLVQQNKDTGRRDVYLAHDSSNIAKWGILQLYQNVDENLNPAQIKEMLNNFALLKNRESKSLKISAIGDIRVRAGYYLRILIEEYGINQPFLVDECTHSFEGETEHTMSLELKVI